MRDFSNLINFWYEKPISARRLSKNENRIQPIATEIFSTTVCEEKNGSSICPGFEYIFNGKKSISARRRPEGENKSS
jgi:hypothetical protein